MRSSTSRLCDVRESNNVGSTPITSSRRFVIFLTSCTVSSSWPTPRWLRVSHCKGISTPLAAVRATVVKMSRVGGQSSRTTSYAVSSGASAALRICSRPVRVSNSCSAVASSMVAGTRSTPSWVLMTTSAASADPVSTWWTESSTASGSYPNEKVKHACGSRSTSSTRSPRSAIAAPSDATVVVFATPPFWLATATTHALRLAGALRDTSRLPGDRPQPSRQLGEDLVRRHVAAQLVIDLASAVVVAGAGPEHAQPIGEPAEPRAGLEIVILVIDLEPVEPVLTHQPGQHGLGEVAVPPAAPRMGDDRYAAGLVDLLDATAQLDRIARDMGRAAVGEKPVEGFLAVGDVSSFDQGIGNVRAADRRTAAHLDADLLLAQWDAERGKPVQHRRQPHFATTPDQLHLRREPGMPLVWTVTQQVNALAAEAGGQLDPADHL